MERLIPIEKLEANPKRDEELVDICYRQELDRIQHAVRDLRQSVLVSCDRILVDPIFRALRAERRCTKELFVVVESSSAGGLLDDLGRKCADLAPDKVVVLLHLGLMGFGRNDSWDASSKNLMYYLHWRPDAVFLAFKEPEIPIPEVIERSFGIQVTVFGTPRERLAQIVTQDEALRFGDTHLDIYNTAKHFSGLNIIQTRRLLQRIRTDCAEYPTGWIDTHAEVRRSTLAADYVQLPETTFDDVKGCDAVIEELRRDVLSLLERLALGEGGEAGGTLENVKRVEGLIPRRILFEGPPGTGKTLLAKALANHLNAAVIVVNGPELLGSMLGESEQRLRQVFSRARRSAPAVIIFDEMDAIGAKRDEHSASGGAATMNTIVNTLLTEMGGVMPDELVFVIGTTNHKDMLDPALLSRIQKVFRIPYPDVKGRHDIIVHYNRTMSLGLDDRQIEFLVCKTEAWINAQNWRRFGGRELQALCTDIDRRSYDFSNPGQRQQLKAEELGDLVMQRIESYVPRTTFADIAGYEDVKRQLREDILEPLRMARNLAGGENREEIESVIPRGVIFEGPPGTGKTLFATALANELGASIIVIGASELKSKWYGETEGKTRELFRKARENSPAIIVFDEIDALARERSGAESSDFGSHTDSGLVNQLLTEMDGLRSRDMVFVVGTTNIASVLDPAFKRPSRFSRIIHIPYPDIAARRAIMAHYDAALGLQLREAHYETILAETENWIDANKYIRFSGDHLRSICHAIKRRQFKGDWVGCDAADSDWLYTLVHGMIQVPFRAVDMEQDIGGYDDVKAVLTDDILRMLQLVRDRTLVCNALGDVLKRGWNWLEKGAGAGSPTTVLALKFAELPGQIARSGGDPAATREWLLADPDRRAAIPELIASDLAALLHQPCDRRDQQEALLRKLDALLDIRHVIPQGVVFYGPPGTGKTLFARALATSLHASIRIVSGPELKSSVGGKSATLIREIFDQARRFSPSIIVFDEFDSLATSRDASGEVNCDIVNQLLTELDGMKTNELVFVAATTNRLENLDQAILRPGRFEFQIEIPYPDEAARQAIFDLYNRKYKLGLSDKQVRYVVFRTELPVDLRTGARFTGDHIEAVCRTLLRLKHRDPALVVDDKLLDHIVRGRTNLPAEVMEEDKRIVAAHEAGHAIVAKYHPKARKPRRISILAELPGAGGYVQQESSDRITHTESELRGIICVKLGGRAAELMLLGEQSTGCSSDLQAATNIATQMVSAFGMNGEIGPRHLQDAEIEFEGRGRTSVRKTFSHPQLVAQADAAIKQILDECQRETDAILVANRPELERLREQLIVCETVNFHDEE